MIKNLKFNEKGTIILCSNKSFININKLEENIKQLKNEYQYNKISLYYNSNDICKDTTTYLSKQLNININGILDIKEDIINPFISFEDYTYRDLYECLMNLNKAKNGKGRPLSYENIEKIMIFLYGENGVINDLDKQISIGELNSYIFKIGEIRKEYAMYIQNRYLYGGEKERELKEIESGDDIYSVPRWYLNTLREIVKTRDEYSELNSIINQGFHYNITAIDLMYYIYQYKNGTRDEYKDIFVELYYKVDNIKINIPDVFIPNVNELKIYCGMLDDVITLGVNMKVDTMSADIIEKKFDKTKTNMLHSMKNVSADIINNGFVYYVYDHLARRYFK